MTTTLAFVMLLGLGDHCDQQTRLQLAEWYFDREMPQRAWNKQVEEVLENLRKEMPVVFTLKRATACGDVRDAVLKEYELKRELEIDWLACKLSHGELVWYLTKGRAGEIPSPGIKAEICTNWHRLFGHVRQRVESKLQIVRH